MPESGTRSSRERDGKNNHDLDWTYQGVLFKDEDIPNGAIGFIYEMSAIIDGKSVSYIGKKNFLSNRRKKLSKKAQSTDKRKKRYTIITKYDYHDYYSSNDILKNAHKEGIQIKRNILKICLTKSQLTYQECKHQFALEVLEKDNYLNGNILGRFFKHSVL